MSKILTYKMEPDKFLRVATNVVFKTLLETQRAEAKRLFNSISEGKRVSVLNVRMEDDSEMRFDMSLDHSEYRGARLNFTAFRESVAGLVAALTNAQQQDAAISVFTEQSDGSMLFGVPGVTREGEHLNALMLGVNTRGPGTVLLKLMYLDPSQFEVQETGQGAAV
jgi:hypothetical protein